MTFYREGWVDSGAWFPDTSQAREDPEQKRRREGSEEKPEQEAG